MSNDEESFLIDVLNGEYELDEDEINRLKSYVEVTPRGIAIFHLKECEDQLTRWNEQPLRLILAAKAAHLSLQAALIDALAGSASIGAYPPKLRKAYLAYFNQPLHERAEMPTADYVMHFDALLAEAKERPLEWSQQKLEISDEQLVALNRLTGIRHSAEHPKPGSHHFEPRYVLNVIPVAAQLVVKLLNERSHHYNEGELDSVVASVAAIDALCA